MRKAVATLEHSPGRLGHVRAPFAQHSRWRAAATRHAIACRTHDELEATGEKPWPPLLLGINLHIK